METPAFYRARVLAIEGLIKEIPVSDEKNNNRVLLRNGFVPGELLEKFEKAVLAQLEGQKQNTGQLSFTELCSFNTWFAMHPEKIAGIEYVTSSREFPIMIKGTKDDIVQVVSNGLQGNQDKRIRVAKAQAAAKLKLLGIIKL